MKVTVDQDNCCGSGQCVMTAPEVFDQRDEDGIVSLVDAHPPQSSHAAVHEAADMWPAAAITVHET